MLAQPAAEQLLAAVMAVVRSCELSYCEGKVFPALGVQLGPERGNVFSWSYGVSSHRYGHPLPMAYGLLEIIENGDSVWTLTSGTGYPAAPPVTVRS